MNENWLYSESRMSLRQESLAKLLKKYGRTLTTTGCPAQSSESIYACAHDWVSQGHPTTNGILKYFEAYYSAESRADDLSSVVLQSTSKGDS